MNKVFKNIPGKVFSRILVTGDQGFVGRHALAGLPGATGLSTLKPALDIRDKKSLLECLQVFQPDAVLHLAAVSFVPDSFKSPETTFEVNLLGTLRLLEALQETGFKGSFVYAGTGDAYGRVQPEDLPIREDRALKPLNPYAVSKAASEALCFQRSQTGLFEITMARPFNHIGAGQSPTFAISDFARQIAEIAAGERPAVLNVGNIDATRDFTDVADVVVAYRCMLAHGQNGEIYNICSGVERSVRTMLLRLLSLSGVNAEIVVDKARYRPAEQQRVCGSHQKLMDHTGWQPIIPIDESLLTLYRYWEARINESKKNRLDYGNNRTGRGLPGKAAA